MRSLWLLGWVALVVLLLLPALREALARPRPLARVPRDELVKDPVCQTYVVRSRAVRRDAGGASVYFCSDRCAERWG